MGENSTAKTVKTYWEVWHYDVWGNSEEGYSVNDRRCSNRALELDIPVTVYNVGTAREFESAGPTDSQIREALSLKDSVEFECSVGDDIHIYPETEDDTYPLGELFCISHSSLSPVREVEGMTEVIEYAKRIRY
jgi:hypothetical protein